MKSAERSIGFNGRRQEIELLERLVNSVKSGEGRLVTVTGHSGIGKTRLSAEVSAIARAQNIPVIWGTAWPEGNSPALWPWPEVLLGLGDTASLSSDADADADAGAEFAVLLEAARRVQEQIGDQPHVLVLDDLHYAEPNTAMLCRMIAQQLVRMPVLLVLNWQPSMASFRYSETHSVLNRLRIGGITIDLAGLEPSAVAELAAEAGADNLGDEAIELLHRRTDGHPVLLHALLSEPASLDLKTVPRMSRPSLDQRLDLLPKDRWGVLRRLAVVARPTSVVELGTIFELDVADISPVLAYAAEVGVATSSVGDGRYELANELYRLRVLERELEADVADDHFRVGQYRLLRHAKQQPESGGAPFHLAEAARLGLAEATPLAVDTLKQAAAHALGVGSYKAAAKHFGNAVEVHGLHLGPPPPALLVARAEAVLRSGRLADARMLFDEAARLAEEAEDFISLAVAALRMGGVWVNERRDVADRARTAAIQQRALQLLNENVPNGAVGLALRLEARIIAEEVYHGGNIAGLERIVELAEAAGENRALAESLLMVYNCQLGPQNQDLRQKLTRRILDVCSAESDETIRLTAGCMHSVDLMLSHQLGAMAAFNSWRLSVNAVGPKHLQYVARGIEVMNLTRAGRLGEAEELAHEVFDYGVRVGNSDAFAFLGGQLMGTYTVQGRCVELLDMLQDAMFAPDSNRADVSMVAGAAFAAASADDERLASQALDILLRDGLESIPQISTWLASMAAVAASARLLGRVELAQEVYDLLIPYRHLPIRPSLAVTCFGSVEMALAWAASVFAKPELATDHYERAIKANARFDNRPYRALMMAELAKHLISHATTGQAAERVTDRSVLNRAQGLLLSAIDEASECEMPLRVKAWTAIANELGPEQPEGLRLNREGQWWNLELGSDFAAVKHSVGMSYINQLVSRNGRELRATDLVQSGVEGSGRNEVADRQALASYQTRIEDLRAEVDLASELNDVGRAANAQDELEQLLEHLRSSTGLLGKSRSFIDETERARVAARKAIKRAIDRIAESNETIGDHLRKAIRTGRHCSYRID